MISLPIDRAVGPVDANGYLVNPAPLIAKGIIPASVLISMPAYDVDFDGAPPPERDEVWLNGTEFLGYLTGQNNTWVPNSFVVGIDKIKFPAPPAPGATPTPVDNIIEINIDILATGRWCTSIDWVTFAIPIRPKVALILQPAPTNRVRQNTSEDTIDVVFRQSFDADCNLTTDIGPADEYPFFGPTPLATLHAKLESCPPGSLVAPLVKADWSIAGTGNQGTASWTGLEGDINLDTPAAIGAYDVDLTFDIDDGEASTSATRKLFVTKAAPQPAVAPPRRTWLEKGTAWASGLTAEADIFQAVMSGLYGYGQANWRYGYNFGSVTRCSWDQLVADPLTCDYGDCFMFSDVLENISGSLGLSGLAADTPQGTVGMGFLTTASPSLDPAFPGNAKPVGGSVYDRYRFSSHSLRSKGGVFYDSTFNHVYASDTEFIAASFDGGYGTDANGFYETTFEGAKVYAQPGNVYDSWGNNDYSLATPFAPFSTVAARGAVDAAAAGIGFTGDATYLQSDPNADGFADSLVANVDVEVSTPGLYTVIGFLKKNGKIIANRPRYESSATTRVSVSGPAGVTTVALEFSGEQIFRSGEDGPYDLQLVAIGGTSPVLTVLTTPVFDHDQFGELPSIRSVTDEAVDETGDGRFDAVDLAVEVLVLTPGEYQIPAELSLGSSTITRATAKAVLAFGTQIVHVRLPGQPIRRLGTDGPFNGVVSLVDATGHNLGSTQFVTKPYVASQFAALLLPDGRFSDFGLDTNGNGLFELLGVTFGAEVTQAGTYLLSGVLRNPTRPLVVFAEDTRTFVAGGQEITMAFSGPLINRQRIDGPYEVEVVVRDPSTRRELDRLVLGQSTAAYVFTDFESFEGPQPPIALTGDTFDAGIDTDGDGQYDELEVEAVATLTTADHYYWSARLFDVNGTDLGFSASNGDLPAGTVSLGFTFDGAVIGANGVDGPYFVRSLLMYGLRGANLVAIDVARTQPYHAFEFAGGNHPPVADAGPDQTVQSTSPAGAEVTLDGSHSFDPDDDVITYTWAGPAGTFYGPTVTLTLPRGSHTFTLSVDDGRGGVATDEVTVTVLDSPPVAEAGPDQTVECTSFAGCAVTLDGSASSDVDGDALTYSWNGEDGTFTGATVQLTLSVGSHAFTLTVDDGYGGTATDTVTVSVVDTTPPVVTAALEPVRLMGYKRGLFVVRFDCTDRCDAGPGALATLNGIPVQNGDSVVLQVGKSEFPLFIEDAQLFLRAPSFELTAICTDASGNSSVATAVPVFRECEHGRGLHGRPHGEHDSCEEP